MPRVVKNRISGIKHKSGFTLIELMIAVLIVGILASIAVMNYTQYVLRSHRTEARVTLRDYAAKQERYYSRNNAYADTPATLGVPAVSEGGGRYTIAMASDDAFASNYTITATANGSQAKDTECTVFTLDSLGVASSSDDGGAATSCW
ncbi:MAG: type IV pilin protein [Gammaproteobacteria bacterium]|nr:type IV pilin protein [Gammaproteobacteria bacterium]